MLLSEELIYAITIAFAFISTVLSFIFPMNTSISGPLVVGRITAAVRATLFPLIAGVLWIFAGVFTISANNCSILYNACFTSPTFTSTTTSTFSSPFTTLLGWFLGAFGGVMVVYGLFMMIYVGFAEPFMEEIRKV